MDKLIIVAFVKTMKQDGSLQEVEKEANDSRG
jgi:hypothetical protein